MDHHERSVARARAEWRAKRAGKTSSSSLWEFENWGDGRTQGHHPGRRKFSPEEVSTVPAAMHPELTRRGEEEHPPLGSDPGNRLERQGRLFLGWSDMFEALADACRWIGESMLAAVDAGHTDVNSVSVPKGLLSWIARIAQYLATAVDSAAFGRNND
jgi:hypothetical protein